MYANGEAVRWYRLAAEQGYAAAQFNLGVMYATGEGVPEDDAEAVRWYRLAAEQGYAAAQFNLGLMYATGEGVPEDAAEAVRWVRLAAEQGDVHRAVQPRGHVRHRRGRAQGRRRGGAVGTASPPSRVTPPRSSTSGSCHATGEGVPKDAAEAVRWVRLAAEQGYATAQSNLGLMYATGEGVPEDAAEAERGGSALPPSRVTPPRSSTSALDVRQRRGCARGRRRGGAVVPPCRRAGLRRRAAQPRGHVRHRRGRAQGRRRGGAVGTALPPSRVTPPRSSTSGSCTPTARVCPRTPPRRCGGTASPLSRATPPRSPTSGSCTPTARACPRTPPRRCGGTASPPSRATPPRSWRQPRGQGTCQRRGGAVVPHRRSLRVTPPRSSTSGSCTPTARVCLEDAAEAVRWYALRHR